MASRAKPPGPAVPGGGTAAGALPGRAQPRVGDESGGERVLARGAGERGLGGREGADLSLFIGLQGQEVGLAESLGSLAEGPEKGCLAEARGRPSGSTGGGEKGREVRGGKGWTELAGLHHGPHAIFHVMTISGVSGGGTGWVTEAPRGHTAVRGCAGIRTQPVTRCVLLSHSRGMGIPPHQAFSSPPSPPQALLTQLSHVR